MTASEARGITESALTKEGVPEDLLASVLEQIRAAARTGRTNSPVSILHISGRLPTFAQAIVMRLDSLGYSALQMSESSIMVNW